MTAVRFVAFALIGGVLIWVLLFVASVVGDQLVGWIGRHL